MPRHAASLAITNAHVMTMDAARPTARAIVIHDGIITYVGSDEGARSEDRGVDERIDAKGRTVLPGFNDAHGHFIHEGLMVDRLDLSKARSVKEVYAKIRAFAKERPDLPIVMAERWEESLWEDLTLPDKAGLDAAAGGRPVLCRRVCGHIAYASSALLDLYEERWEGRWDGVNRQTGRLEEEPSLQFSIMVPPAPEALDRAAAAFVEKAQREGVTSGQDFANVTYWRAWQRRKRAADRAGEDPGIRMDVATYVEHLDAYLDAGLETGTGDDWLAVGGLKIFADGSIGGHTAALRDAYHDKHDEHGLLTYTDGELYDLVLRAHEGALQVRMHVIGDAAVDQGARAYERLAEEVGEDAFRSMRHRFEHFEMSGPKLRARVKELGIVLSMQPNFVGHWSEKKGLYGRRLGARHMETNPFGTLAAEGQHLAFGSDIMPFGPLDGIRDVMRAPYAHMRLDFPTAMRAYTLGSAYGQHREHVKGSLAPGLLGDVVVLTHDLGSAAPADPGALDGVKVATTIHAGRAREVAA